MLDVAHTGAPISSAMDTHSQKELKARARQQTKELRGLLQAWDPMGIFTGDPSDDDQDDEYDCLEAPLLSRLARGATAKEIREHLARELVDHFGLGPEPATGTEFPERVVRWYAERWAEPLRPDRQ